MVPRSGSKAWRFRYKWNGKARMLSLGVYPDVSLKEAREKAKRVKQICGQVFRYAVATGRAASDISKDLTGALSSPVVRHYPTILDPVKIGDEDET